MGNRDANHGALARVYESLGCVVIDTHGQGFGFPDAVVGLVGVTELVEFKTEGEHPNAAQRTFIDAWRGSKVRIVRSSQDVFDHVAEVRKRVSGARL
jgi:hypothetical protein